MIGDPKTIGRRPSADDAKERIALWRDKDFQPSFVGRTVWLAAVALFAAWQLDLIRRGDGGPLAEYLAAGWFLALCGSTLVFAVGIGAERLLRFLALMRGSRPAGRPTSNF
jgi:hypothetical protein